MYLHLAGLRYLGNHLKLGSNQEIMDIHGST